MLQFYSSTICKLTSKCAISVYSMRCTICNLNISLWLNDALFRVNILLVFKRMGSDI